MPYSPAAAFEYDNQFGSVKRSIMLFQSRTIKILFRNHSHHGYHFFFNLSIKTLALGKMGKKDHLIHHWFVKFSHCIWFAQTEMQYVKYESGIHSLKKMSRMYLDSNVQFFSIQQIKHFSCVSISNFQIFLMHFIFAKQNTRSLHHKFWLLYHN